MQKPHYAKECMTAEKLAKGFDMGDEKDSNCKTTVTSNTSTTYEAHVACSGAHGNYATNVRVTADSSSHVIGTFKSDASNGANGMAFSGTFEGKWLGADCGAIKDRQEEPPPK